MVGYPFPMAREYNLEIAEIDATLVSIEKVLDLPKLEAEAVELEAEAGVPNLWDDPEKAHNKDVELVKRCHGNLL